MCEPFGCTAPPVMPCPCQQRVVCCTAPVAVSLPPCSCPTSLCLERRYTRTEMCLHSPGSRCGRPSPALTTSVLTSAAGCCWTSSTSPAGSTAASAGGEQAEALVQDCGLKAVCMRTAAQRTAQQCRAPASTLGCCSGALHSATPLSVAAAVYALDQLRGILTLTVCLFRAALMAPSQALQSCT